MTKQSRLSASRTLGAIVFSLLMAGLATGVAADEVDPYATLELSEELLLRLREAAPAPLPDADAAAFSESESQSSAHREVERVDLETGEVGVSPARDLSSSVGKHTRPGFEGVPHEDGPISQVGGFVEGFDVEGSIGAQATPSRPYQHTTSYPFSAVMKLLMRFDLGGGVSAYYVCSAAAIDASHALTAGHCVFNHDPNDDGNRSDAGWAAEVWAFAGQTDRVGPMGTPDHPFGRARVTLMRSYTGWTESQNLAHDWAVVTLDRPLGETTGWFGVEANVRTSALNFSGYPAETPYVPSGNPFQYPGYDDGNVRGYSSSRIAMDALTYGGHSGGPVWRFDDTNRYIQGTNSTSNRGGYAEATLIDATKFADMVSWLEEDARTRVPVRRPDVSEFFHQVDAKALRTGSARPGEAIDVEYNVLNNGHADAGGVRVEFYLSRDQRIDRSDRPIGSTTVGTLAAFSYTNPVTRLVVPRDQPAGSYFVGWTVSTSTSEYTGEDNAAIISERALVVGESCAPDRFEDDGAPQRARPLEPGSQDRSLCSGDRDWARFELDAPTAIALTTGGPTGDTKMGLFNEDLDRIAFDDDGGTGAFSRISVGCDRPLDPGVYFVEVGGTSGASLPSYALSLAVTQCDSEPNEGQPVAGRKLKVKDREGNPEKRRLAIKLSDSEIDVPGRGSSGDPIANGARVVVANPVTGESMTLELPPWNWRQSSGGYDYRSAAGPCSKAKLREGSFKVICKGSGLSITLDEQRQGRLVADAQFGDQAAFCADFGGTVRDDHGVGFGTARDKGMFQAVDAPRPASCRR